MQHRDLIKDQIEQLGRVLGKIIATFLGIKNKEEPEQLEQITIGKLKSEADIDMETVLNLSGEDLKKYLIQHQFDAKNINFLADLVTALGKNFKDSKPTQSKSYFSKAIELLNLADEISETISFERLNKKIEIEKQLKSIS
ncbi:MAG: hypothetical protein ACWA41_09030 [Putridiphycobacter sp.]